MPWCPKMRLHSLFLALALALSCASASFALGPVVCAKKSGQIAVYTCVGTGDATNSAAGTVNVNGFVLKAIASAETAAPPNAWSFTLVDSYTDDVMNGVMGGGALPTEGAEAYFPTAQDGSVVFPFTTGVHTVNMSSIGDGNIAMVILYVKE